MALAKHIIDKEVTQLANEIQSAKVVSITVTDPYEFVFFLDINSSRKFLLISVQKPIARLHLVKNPPHPKKEVFAFAESLQVLKGATLDMITVDPDCPLVTLRFQTDEGAKLLLVEITNHPKAYLVDEALSIIESTQKEPPSHFEKNIVEDDAPEEPANLEEWAKRAKEKKALEKEKNSIRKQLKKKCSSFDKAIEKATKTLSDSMQHSDALHVADLLKAHYGLLEKGLHQVTVSDWEKENQEVSISLDPKLSPKEQLDSFFKKSQKLKKSIKPLQDLLDKLAGDQQKNLHLIDELDAIDDISTLNDFKEAYGFMPAKPKVKEPPLPYLVFTSSSGKDIFVGKNSESNHQLTFKVANGSDLWLHAHSVAGAHVVIRKKQNEEIDSQTLEDALQLALFHSKAKAHPDKLHEVLITEKKYVSRYPTTPKGKAYISKHKIMNACIDPTRIDAIKKQKKN